MAKGTHGYQDDPRNAAIQIGINGKLFPRAEAKVSVFDSGFVLGDGVWGRHGYPAVAQSTGFKPYGPVTPSSPRSRRGWRRNAGPITNVSPLTA